MKLQSGLDARYVIRLGNRSGLLQLPRRAQGYIQLK